MNGHHNFPAKKNGGMIQLNLLPIERSPLCRIQPAITTITFFQLPSDDTLSVTSPGQSSSMTNGVRSRRSNVHAEPLSSTVAGQLDGIVLHFQQRVNAIIDANPWLRSELRYDSNGIMAAFYPSSAEEDTKRYFKLRSDLDLCYPKCLYQYEELLKTVHPAQCKTSNDSIDKSIPLWKVSVIPCKRSVVQGHDSNLMVDDLTHVALVVSANHSLLDGQSFYRLYNMLSIDEPIKALNPIRKQDAPAKIIKALNNELSPSDKLNIGFYIVFLVSRLLCYFFPKALCRSFYINESFIAEEKRKAMVNASSESEKEGEAVSFVSTNDIITSEIFKCAESDYTNVEASLAVNFRNRIDNCFDDDVGNYENFIIYKSADFQTASLIRKSLSGKHYFRASKPPTKRCTRSQI